MFKIQDSNMEMIIRTVTQGIWLIQSNISDEVTIKLKKREKTENEAESIACIMSMEPKD